MTKEEAERISRQILYGTFIFFGSNEKDERDNGNV